MGFILPIQKSDPSARFLHKLTYQDVLEKQLRVMDASAIALCRDHNLPIRVFNMNKPNILKNIISGSDDGTLITA